MGLWALVGSRARLLKNGPNHFPISTYFGGVENFNQTFRKELQKKPTSHLTTFLGLGGHFEGRKFIDPTSRGVRWRLWVTFFPHLKIRDDRWYKVASPGRSICKRIQSWKLKFHSCSTQSHWLCVLQLWVKHGVSLLAAHHQRHQLQYAPQTLE